MTVPGFNRRYRRFLRRGTVTAAPAPSPGPSPTPTPTPDVPLVGPSAGWNGTAGSGIAGGLTVSGTAITNGGAPSGSGNVQRIGYGFMGAPSGGGLTSGTLAPTGHIVWPNSVDLPFTDDQLILVNAFAADEGTGIDGIDRVEFDVEGTIVTVTEQTVHEFTVRGPLGVNTVRPWFGYAIRLDHSAFATDGWVGVQVTIYPKRSDFAVRKIFTRLYRKTGSPWGREVPFGPGQAYTTLKQAIDGIQSQGWSEPHIRVYATADYTLNANTEVFANHISTTQNRLGWICVDANGFNCEIKRDTWGNFRPTHGALWWKSWRFNTTQIEEYYARSPENFKPQIIDNCYLFSETQPDIRNGTRKSGSPFFRCGFAVVNCYFKDVFTSDITPCVLFGNRFESQFCDAGFFEAVSAPFSVLNSMDDLDAEPWYRLIPSIQLAYSGAGTATWRYIGNGAGRTGQGIELFVNGNSVATIASTALGGGLYTLEEAKAAIDAVPGWSATLLPVDPDRGAALAFTHVGLEGFNSTIRPVSEPVTTSFFPHVDIAQNGQGRHDNILVAGNICTNSNAQFMLWGADRNANVAMILNVGSMPEGSTFPYLNQIGNPWQHLLIAHNSTPNQGFQVRRDRVEAIYDETTRILNNVFPAWQTAPDPADGQYKGTYEAVLRRNHLFSTFLSERIEVSPNDGDNSYGGSLEADFPDMFSESVTIADRFKPAAGSAVRTNFKPSQVPFDLNGQPVTNLIGAVA